MPLLSSLESYKIKSESFTILSEGRSLRRSIRTSTLFEFLSVEIMLVPEEAMSFVSSSLD